MKIGKRDIVVKNQFYEPDDGFKFYIHEDKVEFSKKGFWLYQNALSKEKVKELNDSINKFSEPYIGWGIYTDFPNHILMNCLEKIKAD